ncbi:nucleotidyltransferase family protein [Sphingomonas solaris]|uniref:4-diphosphocytidyl-2C-methyl-D-erythritol synthase n=1 Tax=Alterirhizorhabdus solaris TaxID=2529389 RepID=A0A558R6Q6_9SPHN|nr:nucleotidyltransferase family protein [Sphingomonas solaris]TVV75061.1 4-diphosphocytidyl-2C-methyl-D-erythritol synthase [Sphingomonas solaris]
MSGGSGLTALLLAGNRPGVDPLAAAFGVAVKALVPIAGETMLSRVARTLVDHPAIGRVIVLAQDPSVLTDHTDTRWLESHPAIFFEPAGVSVSAAIHDALERHGGGYPFLVTTADHPLLDTATIDAFLSPAQASGADVAVGLVERRVMRVAFPDNQRTWLRFRGGAYSGANLFLLSGTKALAALRLWRTIEQQRKKGRAVIGAFGPVILLGVALRLLSLDGALARAGRRLGLTAKAIPLPIAEACIDVDKPADHVLATAILERRARDIATIRS